MWKSLRILDIAFGAISAQTPATMTTRQPAIKVNTAISISIGASLGDGSGPLPLEYLSMSATYGVCTILEQITHDLDHQHALNVASVRYVLKLLQDCSSSLPSSVKLSTVSSPSMSQEQRRQVLGNFAVSCFYYYSVILATWPMFHQVCRQRPLQIASRCARQKRWHRSASMPQFF